MSAELTVLVLAALLQFAQIGLYSMAMTGDNGVRYNMGPRDSEPALSPVTGRLKRALANHYEALPLFAIGVLAVVLAGKTSTLTATAAWIYLAARVLYVPAYAFGWAPWRSVFFGIGAAATVVLLILALGGSR